MDQPTITSAANPRIRAALRLRERRPRDETGLTLVDGIREVRKAIDAGVELSEVFVGTQLAERPAGAELLAALEVIGAPVVPVAQAALERLAFGDRSEGVVAVIRIPEIGLDRLTVPRDALVAIVEAVEKPGNLGAILRSADGARAHALVSADPRTDLFNPNAIRASLGTIFTVPVAEGPSAAVLGWAVDHGLRIVAARVDAEAAYADVDLTGPVAIVLGSEAEGLGTVWHDPRVVPVRIPMLGAADSLNVSVAAAVLLYEARRQRGWRDE